MCKLCQLSKANTENLARLYKPLPILRTPYKKMHIDFVAELLEDNIYIIIMTYTDHYSNMVVLVPLCKSDIYMLVNRFQAEAASFYGLLSAIIGKRNLRFQANF